MRMARRVAPWVGVGFGLCLGSGAGRVSAQDGAESLKFSKDIAPILAGNCVGCHNPERLRGGLDLTTFRALQAGSKEDGPVVVAKKPEESLLVEMVSSREMPKGDRKLADESIAKIRRWVEEGATLDDGISPTAKVQELAPSPEARRRSELKAMTPEKRDEALIEKARERWKLAGLKSEPEVTPGKHFLIFGDLPPERAAAALKALESRRMPLGNLLGEDNAGALAGPQKLSVYVFSDLNPYVELSRSLERKEPDKGATAHANFTIEAPYIAAVDPQAGPATEEKPTETPSRGRARRGTRPRAGSAEADGPGRTLAGLLVEQLGTGAIEAVGTAPRWLSKGFGAYLASGVESRSSFAMDLRRTVIERGQLGWEAKATEALGDQAEPESLTAFGFALCEWLQSSFPEEAPSFLRALIGGGENLDEALQLFGEDVSREEFLASWGEWVAARYGPLARRGR